MKTIYDYIVFSDDIADKKHGNHVVERLQEGIVCLGKTILSFRQQIFHSDPRVYYSRRIKFSSTDLEKVKEFAILDNL